MFWKPLVTHVYNTCIWVVPPPLVLVHHSTCIIINQVSLYISLYLYNVSHLHLLNIVIVHFHLFQLPDDRLLCYFHYLSQHNTVQNWKHIKFEYQSGLSLSRSVPVSSNRHSVKLTCTHRNFRPCQPALEWQIHLSIPQSSYKIPLLQLNSVLWTNFL